MVDNIRILGKKVGFIGKVSDDQHGDFVIDYFKKDGIDTSNIFRAKNGEKLGLTFTASVINCISKFLTAVGSIVSSCNIFIRMFHTFFSDFGSFIFLLNNKY